MKDEDLVISHVVGYMLSVMKFHSKNITKFKEEFSAIRHADYDCFSGLVKAPQPELLIQWESGIIKTENFSQQSGDADITMHFAIEPSLKKFLNECTKYYGYNKDTNISNLLFRKCGAFEIAAKVQLNKELQNRYLPNAKITLEKTIDELCGYNNIPADEKEILHNGRRFVNMVKLNEINKQFTSWQDGIVAFELAWNICEKYRLKIL